MISKIEDSKQNPFIAAKAYYKELKGYLMQKAQPLQVTRVSDRTLTWQGRLFTKALFIIMTTKRGVTTI